MRLTLVVVLSACWQQSEEPDPVATGPAEDSASPEDTAFPEDTASPEDSDPSGLSPQEQCQASLGLNVLDHGALCDGVTDDRSAIQGLIDSAKGALVCIPPTDDGCALSGSLTVAHPITIAGHGSHSTSRLHRIDEFDRGVATECGVVSGGGTHADGAIFNVTGDHVSILGLHLVGSDYGDVNARNTHGIWSANDPADPVVGLTIKDCTISNVRGRGIGLTAVEDVVIEDNHISRAGYAGIMGTSVLRGSIRRNTVDNIGAPDECHDADQTVCQYINAYGITVTGCTEHYPCSEDILITGNTVTDVPLWVGIMNHGGQRVLIADNTVNDANFLYANTVSTAAFASHDTAFINNTGDLDTSDARIQYDGWKVGPDQSCVVPSHRNALWLVSGSQLPTEGIVAVGNTWEDVGEEPGYYGDCIHAGALSSATIAYNRCTSRFPGRTGINLAVADADGSHSYADVTIAHNEFEVFDELIEGPGIMASDMRVTGNRHLYTGLTYVLEVCGGGYCTSTWDVSGQSDEGAALFDDGGEGYAAVTLPTPTPPAVRALTAVQGADGVTLSWSVPTEEDHDAFLIEHRPVGEAEWVVLAWRPDGGSRWTFTMDNDDFVPFDALVWTGAVAAGSWEFQVRALTGDRLGTAASTTLTVK